MEMLEKLLKERRDFLSNLRQTEYVCGQLFECDLMLHHFYLQSLTDKNG